MKFDHEYKVRLSLEMHDRIKAVMRDPRKTGLQRLQESNELTAEYDEFINTEGRYGVDCHAGQVGPCTQKLTPGGWCKVHGQVK